MAGRGEDPYLGSTLVPVFVKAAQDHGLIVCVKHFLDNNQEIYRQSMSAEVGERQQHEIYLPVFKAGNILGVSSVGRPQDLGASEGVARGG